MPVQSKTLLHIKSLARFASVVAVACGMAGGVAWYLLMPATDAPRRPTSPVHLSIKIEPRKPIDASGFTVIMPQIPPLPPDATLPQIAEVYDRIGQRLFDGLEQRFPAAAIEPERAVPLNLAKSTLLLSEGKAMEAYNLLDAARLYCESNAEQGRRWATTVEYIQGIASLRRGENENCVECRGESSCILPIAAAAKHNNPTGSRTAIRHFTDYLNKFPDDHEARWLLNLAHMTLGEYPAKVDPRYLVDISPFVNSEFNIGRFRDIGAEVGVNRFNQAGGSIMDDFDNDGLLDLAVTTWDATQPMAFYRNAGDGTFEDRSESAGVTDQLGGLFCVQADYNNDGLLDIFIARGAWVPTAMRPTLLRNRGDGSFEDVTAAARLAAPVNSNTACWADIDNDGWIDLFVGCERQRNKLYRNRRDGTFEEIALNAGVEGMGGDYCKGATWIDYDNDGDPDLFTNNLNNSGRLYRNEGNLTFTEVSLPMGIVGPTAGFSCWTWDYDNDGWLDIFATCYERTLPDVIKGLTGAPYTGPTNRLYRNDRGKRFVDVTADVGLNKCFGTMGSNVADFDNDGLLDMYLATGEPNFSTLIPNRMFKNVGGTRFSEITGSTGTGHLQKGHSASCGDWDRDGDVDLFVQMGGAVNGDKYHNLLFDNPGQGNQSITIKLVGKSTNRAAIGARIKVTTDGPRPQEIYRHISSGSSFGANTLQQTIGLGQGTRATTVEVQWPTSRTTQVVRDLDGGGLYEITEGAAAPRRLHARIRRSRDAVREN